MIGHVLHLNGIKLTEGASEDYKRKGGDGEVVLLNGHQLWVLDKLEWTNLRTGADTPISLAKVFYPCSVLSCKDLIPAASIRKAWTPGWPKTRCLDCTVERIQQALHETHQSLKVFHAKIGRIRQALRRWIHRLEDSTDPDYSTVKYLEEQFGIKDRLQLQFSDTEQEAGEYRSEYEQYKKDLDLLSHGTNESKEDPKAKQT